MYLTARGGDDLICSICKEFVNTTLQRDNDDDHDDNDQDCVLDDDIDGRTRPVKQMMMMSSNKAQSKSIGISDHVDMSYDSDDNDDVCRKATSIVSINSQLKIDKLHETGAVKQDDISRSDADVTDMDEDDDSDDLIDRCAICGLSTEEADKLHFDTGDYYNYYCYYYYYKYYQHHAYNSIIIIAIIIIITPI
jgi:hypothetical protein